MVSLHSVNSAMKTQSSNQCKNYLLVVLLCVLLLVGIVVAYLLCLGGTLLDRSSYGPAPHFDSYTSETWEHGWPVAFRERHLLNEQSHRFVFWRGDGALVVSLLVIDLAVFALITGFLIWMFSHRIRLCWSNPRAVFTFSFRQLMIFVTLVCLVFAHYGMTLVESEKEQFSGAALEYMGLDVQYYYIGPKWISRITGSDPYIDSLMGVRGIRIPFDASDDKIQATIVVLGTLHHVKWLDCNMNPALTDNRLAEFLQLPSLASLEDLSFYDTSVTGTAFSKAAHLTNLREVWASNTRINDRTLPLISSIGRIEELWLNETKISEASMKHILDMPYLTDFRAFRTGIRPSMCIPLEARGVTCYVSEKIDSLNIGEQRLADMKKWREEWGEKVKEEKRLKILKEQRNKELGEQRLQELQQYQSKDLDEELQLEIDEGLFLELEEP